VHVCNVAVTSNLNVKLADLGEARFFTDTDPRKLPKYVQSSNFACSFFVILSRSDAFSLSCNRNINWSSPEIMLDFPTSQIHASADIWSLAMVIAEICNGEVPYDTQECRQMTLEAFVAHLRAGNRPILAKEFLNYPWLTEMVLYALFPFTPVNVL
jgi:serine/threonine protein kinase